uniref:Uncharacterized protein n=1 Tax=Acrobeloides nanus TaxID=290746 RepID=A0A914CHZ2_9BILA
MSKSHNPPSTPHRAQKNNRLQASPVLDEIQTVLENATAKALELLASAGQPIADLMKTLMPALSTAKEHLEKIYSEPTAEDVECRRSIVIAGIPEPTNVLLSELHQRDYATVSKIMDEIVESSSALVYHLNEKFMRLVQKAWELLHNRGGG